MTLQDIIKMFVYEAETLIRAVKVTIFEAVKGISEYLVKRLNRLTGFNFSESIPSERYVCNAILLLEKDPYRCYELDINVLLDKCTQTFLLRRVAGNKNELVLVLQ